MKRDVMKKILVLVVSGVCMSSAITAHGAKETWKQQFEKVSDEYLDQVYLRYQPTQGTLAGYHQYDGQLEDYSRKTIDKQVVELKAILARLESIDTMKLIEDKAAKPSYQGYIIFNVRVSAEGVPTALGVVSKSDGITDDLIEKGKEAILKYKLRPAQRKGTPVASTVQMKIDFNLYPKSLEERDLRIVESNIHSQLLTLETIRPWEKNADNYSSMCANGAFTLMERKFASPDERLRSLIAREKQMPALLATARVNLKNPPRVYTEIAIEQLPDIVSFFEHDVPLAFADAQDAALKAEFAQTNAAVIASLKDYLNWLKTDPLAKSNGDFRIGADAFSKKLQYDEMVDLPLDRILEIGWADMRKNQAHFI
jgi:hypothetical protein